jgi:hypothetical protein
MSWLGTQSVGVLQEFLLLVRWERPHSLDQRLFDGHSQPHFHYAAYRAQARAEHDLHKLCYAAIEGKSPNGGCTNGIEELSDVGGAHHSA